jgi:hypothetical protein
MKHIFTSGISLICGVLLLSGCSKEAERVQPQITTNSQNATQPSYSGGEYGDATQNGSGAYTQKQIRNVCINNNLLGINDGLGCTDLSQTKWMITPSGIATAFWEGPIPVDAQLPISNPYITNYEEYGNKYSATTTYDLTAMTMKLVLSNKK